MLLAGAAWWMRHGDMEGAVSRVNRAHAAFSAAGIFGRAQAVSPPHWRLSAVQMGMSFGGGPFSSPSLKSTCGTQQAAWGTRGWGPSGGVFGVLLQCGFLGGLWIVGCVSQGLGGAGGGRGVSHSTEPCVCLAELPHSLQVLELPQSLFPALWDAH